MLDRTHPSLLTNTYSLDATHIFDGLSSFPTHVAHMRFGSFVTNPTPWPLVTARPDSESLYLVALQWLREDRQVRAELERSGRKIRGARRDQVWSPCGDIAFAGLIAFFTL